MTIPNISRAAYWMPFTPNRKFKAAPKLVASAKGMHYTEVGGREVMDGCAGLWCVNAGHGRQEITKAVASQLETLDFAPSFNFGHEAPFEFARRLVELSPDGLDHVFFTNSGSESVDTALKIALAYHRARGEGSRTRLIGRERGYHGVGFGGTSVGGILANRRHFGTLLAGTDHMRHTHLPENKFSRGQPEAGADLADDLERLVALHGADTIAACIVEPLAGSTGVLVPPKGYLERLRAICDRHGILLIFDEVITGFGRLGAPFAANLFGVTPDLMTTAKGLTNGVIPMGAVFASTGVFDAMMQGPEEVIELFHGYTYSGNPASCAAGMATLDIYRNEGLLTRAAELSPVWSDAMHGLQDAPHVVDIRSMGLVCGIEVAPRDGIIGARGQDVYTACWEAGLFARITGDTLALSPPLIISPEQIEQMASIIRGALEKVA